LDESHNAATSVSGNKDIENLELCGWGFYDHPTDFDIISYHRYSSKDKYKIR